MKKSTKWILLSNLIIAAAVFIIATTFMEFHGGREDGFNAEEETGAFVFSVNMALILINLGMAVICLLVHIVMKLTVMKLLEGNQVNCLPLFGAFFLSFLLLVSWAVALLALLAVPIC